VATIRLEVLCGERGAKKGLKETAGAAGEAERGMTRWKVAAAAAGAVAAAAILKFSKTSIDKFGQVGRETLQLQRYMGGTVEDASRLRFAAQQAGVGTDVLGRALGIVSKNLVAANPNTKAGAELMAKLGFSVRDAQGQLLPMSTLLPKIAQRFATMPAGPEKTALALKLFGRNGAALLPFLNRGAAGIAALQKQSDQLGNTLSGKDIAAIKANIVARRQWQAALTGLQIQLGRNLYPALTKVGEGMTWMVGLMQRNGAIVRPLLGIIAGLAGSIIAVNTATRVWTSTMRAWTTVMGTAESRTIAWTAIQKLWTVATKIATVVQYGLGVAVKFALGPIGLIILAITAVAAGVIYAYKHSERFREIVQTMGRYVVATFRAILGVVGNVIGWIRRNWPLLLAILTGPVGLAARWIIQHWRQISDGARNAILGVASWFRGLPGRIMSAVGNLARLLYNKGRDVLLGFLAGLKSIWTSITNWVAGIGRWIAAHKGPVSLDRRLLYPAGRAIMEGFYHGLDAGSRKAWAFVKGVGGKTIAMLQSIFAPIGRVASGTNVSIGQNLAAVLYGWVGEQWQALRALWTAESGWNNLADNPTSTAFGIPQFLASTAKQYGVYGSTSPVAQITAGLRYIHDVYGNPRNAWLAWLARSPHWYRHGGHINEPVMGWGMRSGQAYGFGEAGPETVVPGTLVPVALAGGGGPSTVVISNAGVIGSRQELDNWLVGSLDRLRRTGRLPQGV